MRRRIALGLKVKKLKYFNIPGKRRVQSTWRFNFKNDYGVMKLLFNC
jgi:hypothetical protein